MRAQAATVVDIAAYLGLTPARVHVKRYGGKP